MPTTGAPGNVWYPDDSDPVAPLEDLFLELATSVNVYLASGGKIHYVADLAALSGLSNVVERDLALCDEGNFYLSYNDGAWVQVTTATFASAAARDTAYAKASAAYRVKGARVYRTDFEWVEEWFSTTSVATAGWFPISGAFPQIEMTLSGQSWPNNSGTIVGGSGRAWTEVRDPQAIHDPSTNPTRITPKNAGWWRFDLDCYWVSNGTGSRIINFRLNGSSNTNTRRSTVTSFDGLGPNGTYYEGYFNGTTDYIEAELYQSSGGTLVPTARLVGQLIRPA